MHPPLTSGPGYILDRLRVGIVHQRIGLEPKWYLGVTQLFRELSGLKISGDKLRMTGGHT
ncbi:MAG: hypothetical protein ACYC2R_07060 [Burkholderiales bacterium]